MTNNSNKWALRNEWVLGAKANIFTSLEKLQDKQLQNRSSLGIIKPKSILDFRVEPKSKYTVEKGEDKKSRVLSQRALFITKKDLELIPYRFVVSFECDSSRCCGHDISILDWEFGQLYRNIFKSPDWKEKMSLKFKQICSDNNDVYFFMGNMAGRRETFCILGLYYPPKGTGVQLSLFGQSFK